MSRLAAPSMTGMTGSPVPRPAHQLLQASLLALTAGCAAPGSSGMVHRERPMEAPIIAAQEAQGLRRVAVIANGTSSTAYHAQLSAMKFDFKPSFDGAGAAKFVGRMALEMPACLIPPLTVLCAAASAAGVGTATTIENAARHRREKEGFERSRSLVDTLAREDLRARVLSRLDERAATRRFTFVSRAAVDPATDARATVDATLLDAAPDALLQIDIGEPFLRATAVPRPFRPDLRTTTLGLDYTATLYAMPSRTIMAKMHRHAAHDIDGHPEDIPRFVHDALHRVIESMTEQIDDALVAPLTARAPSHAPIAAGEAATDESVVQPNCAREEFSSQRRMKACLATP